MPKPIVAIVGRPNVGKSTLLNRLIGARDAVVEETPGITRDRVYGEVEWRGRAFDVVDTGGLGMAEDDPFGADIQQQAELAIEEADLVLLLVDARDGLLPLDEELAELFRRAHRPLLLVANKADNDRREASTPEFLALGLGDVHAVSAHSGRGVGDLLDAVVDRLPPATEEPEEEDRIRIAIVGRPNVGKSSLLNALLDDERVIVSPVAGTTRDAVDVPFEFGEHRFRLIDTAGIRRPGKVQSIEYYCVLRAQRAIERSDIGILVVDAHYGMVHGDSRVGGLLDDAGRGSVIFVNKWDLVSGRTPSEFGQSVRATAPFLDYATIVVGSATRRRGLKELLEACVDAANNHALRLPTAEINQCLREAVERRPYSRRGRELKLYYATQVSVKPPTFVLFVNDPEVAHRSYVRYLSNQLRARYGLQGTPIRLRIRKRKRSSGRK